VGWRDRDYARLTEGERRRLYGSASSGGGGHSSRRTGTAGAAGLIAALVAVLLLLGQLPRGHPLVPALHIGIRPSSSGAPSRVATQLPLRLPPEMQLGSTLTLHGTLSGFDGQLVTVQGRYGGTDEACPTPTS
jgi:hypothetical protein